MMDTSETVSGCWLAAAQESLSVGEQVKLLLMDLNMVQSKNNDLLGYASTPSVLYQVRVQPGNETE